MNDYDIFDEYYFDDDIDTHEYDEATEATALKKAAVGLLGPWASVIGNIVHNSRVNKSRVASLRSNQNTYGDKQGEALYKKTVKFFIDNELLPEGYANASVIEYNMLTPRGKQFMRGYYSSLDEIRQFDFNTAETNSDGWNKEAVVSTGAIALQVANKISGLFKVSGFATVVSRFGIRLFDGALGIGVISTLIATTLNIIDNVKSYKSTSTYKEVIRNVKESVEDIYDENYFVEDDDIFDDEYFE